MKKTVVLLFSFLLMVNKVDVDYKKKFNKALKEIKNDNYEKAIELLKSAHDEKRHSKIAFWLAYSYAQIENKELGLSYAGLALDYQPPLNEVYKERTNKIIEWCRSNNQTITVGRFPASSSPPYFEIEKVDELN